MHVKPNIFYGCGKLSVSHARSMAIPFFGFIFHVSFCGCSKMLSFWL